MIQVCPNCGHTLQQQLADGLMHCSHCNQIFDSSDYNKLLSAAWQARKENFTVEKMKWQLQLPEDLCILVLTFVNDYGYTHDDFSKLLKKLGVSRKSYLDCS